MDSDSDDEEGAEDAAGRAAVRQHLLHRLDVAGLRRGKGLTEADHAEMCRHLVEHLAYLSVPSLVTLADQVLADARGPKRDQWPPEVTIRQMAEALERRPVTDRPIVRSWLASVEGPRAEAGGYLVALFRALRKLGRPIMVYDLRAVQAEAVEDHRRRAMIAERRRAGDDRAEDRAWLSAWVEDERVAREIVDRGNRARAAKGQAA